MKERYWAVYINEDGSIDQGKLCYTWDKKHPENRRKEKSVRVMAIYPRKKDAITDIRFRGGSCIKEVSIKPLK